MNTGRWVHLINAKKGNSEVENGLWLFYRGGAENNNHGGYDTLSAQNKSNFCKIHSQKRYERSNIYLKVSRDLILDK